METTILYSGYKVNVLLKDTSTSIRLIKRILMEVVSQILFEDNKYGWVTFDETEYYFSVVEDYEIYIYQE